MAENQGQQLWHDNCLVCNNLLSLTEEQIMDAQHYYKYHKYFFCVQQFLKTTRSMLDAEEIEPHKYREFREVGIPDFLAVLHHWNTFFTQEEACLYKQDFLLAMEGMLTYLFNFDCTKFDYWMSICESLAHLLKCSEVLEHIRYHQQTFENGGGLSLPELQRTKQLLWMETATSIQHEPCPPGTTRKLSKGEEITFEIGTVCPFLHFMKDLSCHKKISLAVRIARSVHSLIDDIASCAHSVMDRFFDWQTS